MLKKYYAYLWVFFFPFFSGHTRVALLFCTVAYLSPRFVRKIIFATNITESPLTREASPLSPIRAYRISLCTPEHQFEPTRTPHHFSSQCARRKAIEHREIFFSPERGEHRANQGMQKEKWHGVRARGRGGGGGRDRAGGGGGGGER